MNNRYEELSKADQARIDEAVNSIASGEQMVIQPWRPSKRERRVEDQPSWDYEIEVLAFEHFGPLNISGRIDCGVAGHPDQVYSILNTMFQHIGDVSRFVCAQGD